MSPKPRAAYGKRARPAGDRPPAGGVLNITAAVWTAGFHWWRSGNKKRTHNVSDYMLVLALCLVHYVTTAPLPLQFLFHSRVVCCRVNCHGDARCHGNLQVLVLVAGTSTTATATSCRLLRVHSRTPAASVSRQEVTSLASPTPLKTPSSTAFCTLFCP